MHEKPKKIAIITGISGNIGRDIALKLHDEGILPIGLDCKKWDSEIPIFTANLESLVKSPKIQTAFMKFCEPYCDKAEEITLINNAAKQTTGYLMRLTLDDLLDSLHVNAIAPFLLSQLLANTYPTKLKTIVNITSIHSQLTKSKFGAYAISKAALSALTRVLSLEIGHTTRVCEIRPAAIDTDMLRDGLNSASSLKKLKNFHPSGTIGQSNDVVSMLLAIIRTPSIFLNGTVINLDGGISNRLHDPE